LSLVLSHNEFDARLCLSGGQVFGWREDPPGTWTGYDGACRYVVRTDAEGAWVEHGPPDGFQRFVGTKGDGLAEAKCPAVARASARLPGLRLMRPSSVTQTLLCFVCTANNHLARIDQMVERLLELGGGEGFPGLEAVAGTSPRWFRERGFGYRAEQLVDAARSAAGRGGEEWLASLRDRSYHEAVDELRALPGVGPKVGDCVALYGLHHGEAVPVDTHLWHAAAPLFLPEEAGREATEARKRELASRMRAEFGEQAGWAQLVLFADRLTRQGSRKAWGQVHSPA
jgi:N-glycosylase/DNA lyase